VGRQILLADINVDSLAATADLMHTSSYNVRTQPVDVASHDFGGGACHGSGWR
jgi:hypothetical protein